MRLQQPINCFDERRGRGRWDGSPKLRKEGRMRDGVKEEKERGEGCREEGKWSKLKG